MRGDGFQRGTNQKRAREDEEGQVQGQPGKDKRLLQEGASAGQQQEEEVDAGQQEERQEDQDRKEGQDRTQVEEEIVSMEGIFFGKFWTFWK